MAIGLTYQELLSSFIKSWSEANKELQGDIILANEGFDSLTKQFIDGYHEMYPDHSPEQAMAFIAYLAAILRTIVNNNEAIEKTISSE